MFKVFAHAADNSPEWDGVGGMLLRTSGGVFSGTRNAAFSISIGGIVQGSLVENLVEVRDIFGRLRESIRGVVDGKDRVVDLCLISLLVGGTSC